MCCRREINSEERFMWALLGEVDVPSAVDWPVNGESLESEYGHHLRCCDARAYASRKIQDQQREHQTQESFHRIPLMANAALTSRTVRQAEGLTGGSVWCSGIVLLSAQRALAGQCRKRSERRVLAGARSAPARTSALSGASPPGARVREQRLVYARHGRKLIGFKSLTGGQNR